MEMKLLAEPRQHLRLPEASTLIHVTPGRPTLQALLPPFRLVLGQALRSVVHDQ